MGVILPFVLTGAFEPDDIDAMSLACEEVCNSLHINGDAYSHRHINVYVHIDVHVFCLVHIDVNSHLNGHGHTDPVFVNAFLLLQSAPLRRRHQRQLGSDSPSLC